MPSEPKLTPLTAPRDIAELAKCGPYHLRALALDLGGLTTDEQRLAWHSLKTNEARAGAVLIYLEHWDKINTNGAGTVVAQSVEPATPAAVQAQAPKVAEVSPEALTQAATAAASTTEKAKRQPRTSYDNGAQSDPSSAITKLVVGLDKSLETVRELIKSKADADQLQEVKEQLAEIATVMATLAEMTKWTLSGVLFIMEQHGPSKKEALSLAIEDSSILQQLREEARALKAEGKA